MNNKFIKKNLENESYYWWLLYYWWLRSANLNKSYYVGGIDHDGIVGSHGVVICNSVSTVCIII